MGTVTTNQDDASAPQDGAELIALCDAALAVARAWGDALMVSALVRVASPDRHAPLQVGRNLVTPVEDYTIARTTERTTARSHTCSNALASTHA